MVRVLVVLAGALYGFGLSTVATGIVGGLVAPGAPPSTVLGVGIPIAAVGVGLGVLAGRHISKEVVNDGI